MTMTTSALGRKAIAAREGVRLEAYQDTRGIWTIGVGHTSVAGPPEVHDKLVISMADCDSILKDDLRHVEAAVNSAVKVEISQNAFDACVSLAFNIGGGGFAGSSIVKQINAGNMQLAADDFMMWDKPPELKKRRSGERMQFLRSDGPEQSQPVTGAVAAVSIAWIQTRLNLFGAFPQLDTDGDLGPATDRALIAFQESLGLVTDGLIGPETIQALSQTPD